MNRHHPAPPVDMPPLDPSQFKPIPPQRLFDDLETLGYRGQDEARKALCLLAYRHMRRLERRLMGELGPDAPLPPKTNTLLMGPTGCGKTFLVEMLFGKLLPLPVVVIDITGFSETGYVGDSVKTILTRLLMQAEKYHPFLLEHAVICLDEFDKLAGSHSNIRFDGAGTTKDVTGYGVQKELLKMIEGTRTEVPNALAESIYVDRTVLYTHEILFIASGAFSGFKGTARWQVNPLTIGFGREKNPPPTVAYQLAEDEAENIAAFQQYGFLPELIGRFTRIVPMAPLSKETMKKILAETLLPGHHAEFAAEGIDLQVDPAVLDSIVEEALRRQIGARGLGSRVTRILETVAWEGFGRRRGTVEVRLDDGRPVARWK